MYLIRYSFELIWYALSEYCVPDVFVWTGILYGDVLGFSGRIQNLVDGYRVPCHNIQLLYSIKNVSLSYDNLQLALHNILMETKEV